MSMLATIPASFGINFKCSGFFEQDAKTATAVIVNKPLNIFFSMSFFLAFNWTKLILIGLILVKTLCYFTEC